MFQIIFDMEQGTDIKKIKAMLPTSWTVEESGHDDKLFHLKSLWDCSNVAGSIRVLSEDVPGKILIKADEETINGRTFWSHFGMKYNILDPFDLRFGVIYLSDADKQIYELDELPKELPMDPHDLSHYSLVKDAFYVSFLIGHWYPGNSLQVQTIFRIMEDGSIENALDMPKFFKLGNLENEATM